MGRKTLEERFWEKVEKTDTCWFWTGHTTANGYGTFWVGGEKRHVYAHHASMMLLCGVTDFAARLDRDEQWDHLCRVRHCVRPAHLDLVTARTNTLRGEAPSAMNALKTHCKRGHEFTPENTGDQRRGGKVVGRACRTCERERMRRNAEVSRTT